MDPARHRGDDVAARVPHRRRPGRRHARRVPRGQRGRRGPAVRRLDVRQRRRRRRRHASPTPAPPARPPSTVPGSHNSEMGCPGDWQPDCAAAAADQAAPTASGPARSRSPPAPTSTRSRSTAAGTRTTARAASPGAPTSPTRVAAAGPVTFFYDPHDPLVHRRPRRARSSRCRARSTASWAARGTGCPTAWRAWLQDPDGDGTYTFTAQDLPAGAYEVKVAHNLQLGRELRRRRRAERGEHPVLGTRRQARDVLLRAGHPPS